MELYLDALVSNLGPEIVYSKWCFSLRPLLVLGEHLN